MQLFHQQPKLKGGALMSVVGIALIIALVLGSMLMLLHYNRQSNSQAQRAIALSRNLQSATTLALHQAYPDSLYPKPQVTDLFGEENDFISIHHYPWGIYELSCVQAFAQADTLQQTYIQGRTVDPAKAYVLYLQDEGRPLSVSGTTEIRGTAYLPPAGTRKAYIEDKAYAADSTIYGPVHHSEQQLPTIRSAVVNYLHTLFTDSLVSTAFMPASLGSLSDTLTRSFTQQPQYLYSADSLAVDQHIHGAVVLISQKAIHVAATAQLSHVLLFAPKISIDEGFQGSIQAFAQDSLLVAANCTLHYPSALGLLEPPFIGAAVRESTSLLRLGKHSTIGGTVFSIAADKKAEFMNRIELEQGSMVMGDVYADGLLQTKGSVYGSVTCRRFVLQTPASLYDNFVLDAVLNYHKRSHYYVAISLLQTNSSGGLIQWVK